MAYSDGVLFSEISDFQKDLLRQANNIFPDEYKNFLKKEANKLVHVQKKIAKKQVGEDESNNEVVIKKYHTRNGKSYEKKVTEDYHRRFKRGKLYERDGFQCIRAYNSARHAHLIEYGHRKFIRGKDTGKYVAGKYILKQAEYEFADDFIVDAEKFLFEHFDNFKGTHI